jgi:hypothetical protein
MQMPSNIIVGLLDEIPRQPTTQPRQPALPQLQNNPDTTLQSALERVEPPVNEETARLFEDNDEPVIRNQPQALNLPFNTNIAPEIITPPLHSLDP